MTNENKEEIKWTEEKSWMEFRDSGLLWFINRTLHLFGWAISMDCDVDDDGNVTKIKNVFPVRCRYRGFDPETEEDGFKKVTDYMKENVDDLKKDCDL